MAKKIRKNKMRVLEEVFLWVSRTFYTNLKVII